MFFSRGVAKFSRALDFFIFFNAQKIGILPCFFTGFAKKTKAFWLFAQKTADFNLARVPYLQPKILSVDFKRFSLFENAKNFDKIGYFVQGRMHLGNINKKSTYHLG